MAAIGSGGPYALAAARALLAHSALDAHAVAEEAMKLAAEICIYTNAHLTFEELPSEPPGPHPQGDRRGAE